MCTNPKRTTLNFIILTALDEEDARNKAMSWYTHKQNLSIDSVEVSEEYGGFHVWISFDA